MAFFLITAVACIAALLWFYRLSLAPPGLLSLALKVLTYTLLGLSLALSVLSQRIAYVTIVFVLTVLFYALPRSFAQKNTKPPPG